MPLVPELDPDTGRALDLTHAFLRGASPMYTRYLENMGVAMSLTMPLLRGDELWGLIACHHYAGPRVVPQPVRAACEFLAQVASLQLAAAEAREHEAYAARLREQHDALMAHVANLDARADDELDRFDILRLVRAQPGLLACLDAGGAAATQGGRWHTVGRAPDAAGRAVLLDWLRSRGPGAGVLATEALGQEIPEASGFLDVAAGVLAVPVSRGGDGWLLWFRPEQRREVTWAGNPHEKLVALEDASPERARLHPRASFALWRETVVGRSRPWLRVERDAAERLRRAILEVAVAHGERLGRAYDALAQSNAQLLASNAELDAFAHVAGHDLKEPLRGIFSYAHHLSETYRHALDERDRPKLDAILRLSTRMNELIDALLTLSRVGRTEPDRAEVDLDDVLADALDLTGLDAADAPVEVRVPRPLPTLRCDRVRVRAVLQNLLSNAAKYRREEGAWVEVRWSRPPGGGPVELSVADNGIGIKPRYHEQVFELFRRLHAQDAFGGGTGVGLTIVRKIVERHGGRIRVDSEPSRGTTFTFTLAPDEPANTP